MAKKAHDEKRNCPVTVMFTFGERTRIEAEKGDDRSLSTTVRRLVIDQIAAVDALRAQYARKQNDTRQVRGIKAKK